MLRLTLNGTNASRPTIRAEGRLVREWTTLLEAECARLAQPGSRLELDLAGVSDVDVQGIEVLRRLRRSPVTLVGCSSILLGLLSEDTP